MTYNTEFKGFEEKESKALKITLDKVAARHAARLEKKVASLSPGAVFLRVSVERTGHKVYHLSVTLNVPGKVLAARQQNHQPESSLRGALTDLEKQLDVYLETTRRREHLWKRLAKRQQIRSKKADIVPLVPQRRESFFELVGPHLDTVGDFVGHAISIAQATGDLARNEVSADDIVDDTLLRAYAEFLKNPQPRNIENWLMHLAGEQVAAETLRSNSERQWIVHIDDDVPETPPEEAVSTLGDEILDFYQPDEDLRLMDLVPDLDVPSPEEEAVRQELLECVRTQLNSLPSVWRRLLVLHYVDGLKGAQLAEKVAMPRPEAEHILKYAREYLRRKLLAAGCSFKQDHAVAH